MIAAVFVVAVALLIVGVGRAVAAAKGRRAERALAWLNARRLP